MTTFRDRFDKEWNLNLLLEDAWRIEEYDFAGKAPRVRLVPPDEDFFTSRLMDTRTIFGIVWCLVKDQIQEFNRNLKPILVKDEDEAAKQLAALEKNGLLPIEDEMDFAKRLDGKAIEAMKLALWGELELFYPEMATTCRALTGRCSQAVKVANEKLAEGIDRILSDEEITKLVNAELQKASVLMQEAQTQENGLNGSNIIKKGGFPSGKWVPSSDKIGTVKGGAS